MKESDWRLMFFIGIIIDIIGLVFAIVLVANSFAEVKPVALGVLAIVFGIIGWIGGVVGSYKWDFDRFNDFLWPLTVISIMAVLLPSLFIGLDI